MTRLLALVALAGCAHTEPAPCSPADYAALAETCENCPAEIAARRELCEKLIREDDAK